MAIKKDTKTAVITGASSGFGACLARKLAADGWHCVLVARRKNRLEEVAADTRGEIEVCDISDLSEVQAMASRIAERHSAIDLLVNNAGIPGRGGFLDIEPKIKKIKERQKGKILI